VISLRSQEISPERRGREYKRRTKTVKGAFKFLIMGFSPKQVWTKILVPPTLFFVRLRTKNKKEKDKDGQNERLKEFPDDLDV